MRKAILGAAVATCLVVPGVAPAGMAGPAFDPEYGGRVEGDPNHYFGFDVVKQNGVKRVKRMFVVNMPFGCPNPDEDGRQFGGLEGAIKVRGDGRFARTRSYDFDAPRGGTATGLKYTVRGRLSGDRAKGTINIRLKGSGCYSGTLRWRAKKPAPEVPPIIFDPVRMGR